MTREGDRAADAAASFVLIAWLTGLFLFAPPDVSLLAGLVLFFGITASWAVAMIVVGVAVDLIVLRRGRPRVWTPPKWTEHEGPHERLGNAWPPPDWRER